MFGIDLTGSQKMGIGFVVVVLGISGYFLYAGMKAPPDQNVSAWIENHPVGMDQNKRISPTNPMDPNKSTVNTVFAFYDGKLEVTEYAAESGFKDEFTFLPDARRKNYNLYQDPWSKLDSISDPYKKVVSFAAYAAAEGRSLGLFARAKVTLTADQRSAEADARAKMIADVGIVDEGCKRGTFKSDMYNKILDALKAYHDRVGDPSKDSVKAALAVKVLNLVVDYLKLMDKEKQVAIDKYIASLDSILTADQKKALGDNVKLAVKPRPLPRIALAG